MSTLPQGNLLADAILYEYLSGMARYQHIRHRYALDGYATGTHSMDSSLAPNPQLAKTHTTGIARGDQAL